MNYYLYYGLMVAGALAAVVACVYRVVLSSLVAIGSLSTLGPCSARLLFTFLEMVLALQQRKVHYLSVSQIFPC